LLNEQIGYLLYVPNAQGKLDVICHVITPFVMCLLMKPMIGNEGNESTGSNHIS